MVRIILPDGSGREFKTGATPKEIAESIGKRLAADALAAKVDGKLVDLFYPVRQDAKVEIVTFSTPDGKKVFWHSAAHILAHAVKNLYPDAKNTIGPATEDGFFYDFDDLPVKEDDFPKIEEEMKKIIKKNLPTKKFVWTLDDVKKNIGSNPYKIELAKQFKQEEQELTAYSQGEEFVDLCEGPHTPSTANIKAVKLMKLAGAYWKGDQKNKQLTRVYGTAFPSEKELKDYLTLLEEAQKRDHKKIGAEMELYMQHELVGKGLPIWLPKGAIIRREIEEFAIETEKKAGYMRVATPHLAKEELFKKSGHIPHYADSMYPKMTLDDGTYYLKAMNCPIHHLIFGNKTRSYREMPVRLAEYGTVYRNELSGTLSGLLRVRMISQNDAHIYCTKEQIANEIKSVLEMIKYYFEVFGLKNYYFRLSLWDSSNKEKYIDEPENWEYTENALREILKNTGLPFIEAKNEAAFYGPKIDVQLKTVTGREETVSTVQLDFAAKKRFELSYVDKNNKENNEVFVIHRAPLSSHERFVAYLIEHYAGHFPLWLSPEQVRITTIANRFDEFASDMHKKLISAGIRAEFDSRTETLGRKIREAEIAHVNYILVIGEKELQSKTVNVRTRDNKILGAVKIEEFTINLLKEIKEKK
ncbi:MAG: threonine--tRNA ligase [Candidatus Aenigmarchaeota archaeon]|nr:threonine--tRNA ligase [Candidatus Aenigmarchaeota archaeon]